MLKFEVKLSKNGCPVIPEMKLLQITKLAPDVSNIINEWKIGIDSKDYDLGAILEQKNIDVQTAEEWGRRNRRSLSPWNPYVNLLFLAI
jgi:hypothetical protein